eukprot:CAMPEP_0171039020 /NCGR_PEP_ID=MMETSP0736-20130129/43667_1 /TAXON_ID=186038 /ORGANISM="Fragilariopsis kerguelensis, Strain L26-C5" /LENGTH=369 /DNA_ID=CAMNT_0011485743 /DNA_START=120 /DNA_END=1227 /DNA_ORIENTATION=+
MKLFDSVSLAVGIVITAYVAAADATTASPTAIMDITTSNPVIIDLSKDFVTSNSFNDSPGMDMVNTLAESWPNTRIVTVIQDGKIVGEYVRDDDVDPTELRPINSVTKAVSGMLFGILVDQYDTSINTTLGEFFPNETDWNLVDNEATVDYMKRLSAYEILTMTTGLGDNPCWMIGNCTSAIGGDDPILHAVVGTVIVAVAAVNNVVIVVGAAATAEIVDITTSNPVIVDLSQDFEKSNSYNDSPGMDMVNALATAESNTQIVTVIQHGKIVGEYVRDDATVTPNQLHPVYSLTKAVAGMLFGILVDQYDTSINTTLGEFFPNETDWNLVDESNVDYMKSLSAYEILTMTTGLGVDPCYSDNSCPGAWG